MKRCIALLLCGVLLVGLTACGKTEDKGSTATTQSTVTTTTTGEGSSATTTVGGDVADTTTGTAGAENPAATTEKKPTAAATTTTEKKPATTVVPIGTQPVTTTTAPAGKPTATGGDATTTTITTAVATKPTASAPTEAPCIVLPAVGTDIDVAKKKDRIRVSAVAAWYNDDGSVGVSLTFKNYTSNWITEETNYVVYTCYDKNGNVVQPETRLWIGVIDTKKNPEKTYSFNVPADTAEVRLVDSQIVYWTEWS